MKAHHSRRGWTAALLVGGMGVAAWASDPPRPGWQREAVDLRVTGGGRIRSVDAPPGQAPPLLSRRGHRPAGLERKFLPPEAVERLAGRSTTAGGTPRRSTPPRQAVSALIINSPPIDGFVPYIAVSATGEHSGLYETDAIPKTTVGTLIAGRQADYTIGVLDTGASIHIIGNQGAVTVGLFSGNPDRVTSSVVQISGVTGVVDAWVSKAIGVYIDGLAAIDPTLLTLDQSRMVGETNVATAVGQTVAQGQPDLPTVIGPPLSVYYASVFDNSQPLTRTINAQDYTAPDIRFYETFDPAVPEYPNLVPLELRPLGGAAVQYIPCIDIFGTGECPDGDGSPQSPSTIIGNSAQSLFFMSSVDLYDGTKSAIDKDRFIIDTGAQVTVVGQRVGARLALNPAHPEFLVEVQGVDGQSIMVPGFYVDKIEIPALGEWMSFQHVPVILLDVASPEGGTLDGIIGMNLMIDFNMVLRGGGLFGTDDPTLEYEVLVPVITDSDFDNDGDVDLEDLAHMQLCYSGPETVQSAANCLDARLDADSDVDAADMDLFVACASGPTLLASANCAPP